MYYVVGLTEDGRVNVIDTADGQIDTCTDTELKEFLANGLEVYGYSTSYGADPIPVMVREKYDGSEVMIQFLKRRIDVIVEDCDDTVAVRLRCTNLSTGEYIDNTSMGFEIRELVNSNAVDIFQRRDIACKSIKYIPSVSGEPDSLLVILNNDISIAISFGYCASLRVGIYTLSRVNL